MFNLIRNALGRDTQRSKVYKAERRAQKQFADPGRDVSTPDRYRAALADVMASPWMAATYPKAAATEVTVRFNTRMGGAHAGKEGITTGTGPWTMNMLILLHELRTPSRAASTAAGCTRTTTPAGSSMRPPACAASTATRSPGMARSTPRST
jgi:hypothetical protein